MRRVWGAVLAAVLAGAGACGSHSEDVPAPDAASVRLAPPGSPLAAGLVVPVGTRLVGPVFPHVSDPLAPGAGRLAVLGVDGNPFAAWDDLAGQAQDIGVPLAGSGVCTWRRSLPVPGADHTPNVDTPVAAARPEIADSLSCEAAASGLLGDGTGVRVSMRLWWWAAGAELHVQILEGDLDDYVSVWPTTGDPGPAPATAAGQLPRRDAPVAVGPGDRFGRENDCVESGYDRLALPAGSRLVGGGTTPGLATDFAAVLAVEDAEAVLGELQAQLDEPDSSDGSYGLSEEPLADGTLVWSLGGAVSAGGGGCAMWSSPDGTALLVTTSSD
jgi:hypothetical protein